MILAICIIMSLFVGSTSAASVETVVPEGTYHRVVFKVDENGNITILPSESLSRTAERIFGMIYAVNSNNGGNAYTLYFLPGTLTDALYTNRINISVKLLGENGYQTGTYLNKNFSELVLLGGQEWAFVDVALPAGHTYTMEITNLTIPLYDRFWNYLDPSTYEWDIELMDVET